MQAAVSKNLRSVVPPAEQDLVARARLGDRRAIETLVVQHLPYVKRLLLRLLGPRGDFDDLVQIVFLETLRVLPDFRGDSAFGTFIGGITVVVAKRAMRPSAYQRHRATLEAEPTAPSTSCPEEETSAIERLRRLQRALEGLSDVQRIAFSLWALDGVEPRVIAEMMGATLAGTRARIFYAQQHLKKAARNDPWLAEWLGEGDADAPR